MYIWSKQFSDKFRKLYTKSMNDNKIDNDEHNELVKLYEEYMRNRRNRNSADKKKQAEYFFKLMLLLFSYKINFSNKTFFINIYH